MAEFMKKNVDILHNNCKANQQESKRSSEDSKEPVMIVILRRYNTVYKKMKYERETGN